MKARSLYPLTEAQEGLWYTQALDPHNPILNVGQYIELSGPLDRDALITALNRTIAEAEALHLRFQDTDQGSGQWLDPSGINPDFIDLSDQDQPKAKALDLMRADSRHVRDPGREALAAFTLFRLGPEQHLLYERMHHLAVDGYGVVLITDRIGAHYSSVVRGTAGPRKFPPLSRAYEYDAEWRGTTKWAEQGKWWREKLVNLPEITGPAQGRAVSGHDFRRESFWLPKDLLSRLDGFCKSARLNWPDVLTALTGAYLARWSNNDTVIGVPYMARFGSPVAGVPCMAMNVLPQRITPDEDIPLTDWLRIVSAELAAARKNGLYRSEYLRRELGLIGGTRRLYGPLVNVQPFDRPPVFAGLQVGLHILGAGAVDDLTFTFRGDPVSGMLFETDTNPVLYTAQDTSGHAARLPEFISAALNADRLAKVPTASPAEIIAAETIAKSSQHTIPDATLTALIDARIRATPDATAVRFGSDSLSYAELDRRSAALAAELVARGAGPDKIVAIAINRSLQLPVALLAVLRAGAAYLPLDPDHPGERLSRIISVADPVAVLTSPELAERIPVQSQLLTDQWPETGTVAPDRAKPGDMAYVIFTSGSTGEPKGVVIEHRAIVNRLLWMQAHYGIDASDRILQKTPASFDVSVWNFFCR